ncbi:hypothetical protein FOL47_010613, partial [Perkinsus chesapeaki]
MRASSVMYLVFSWCIVVQTFASSKAALQPAMRGQSQEDTPPLETDSIVTTHERGTRETTCSIQSQDLVAAFHLNKAEPVAALRYTDQRGKIHNKVISDDDDLTIYKRNGDESCKDYFQRIHTVWYKEKRYADDVKSAIENKSPVVDEFYTAINNLSIKLKSSPITSLNSGPDAAEERRAYLAKSSDRIQNICTCETRRRSAIDARPLPVCPLMRGSSDRLIDDPPLANLLRGTEQLARWDIVRSFLPLKSGAIARNIYEIVTGAEQPNEQRDITGVEDAVMLKRKRNHKNTSKLKQCMRDIAAKYRFYLSFENSRCNKYITEKFWRPLWKGNVPVVLGGLARTDYDEIAPPGSYIHVDDFKTTRELSNYLQYLTRNDTAYNEYH